MFRTFLNVFLTALASYTAAIGMGLTPKAAGVAVGASVIANFLGLSQEQTNVIGAFISSFKKK